MISNKLFLQEKKINNSFSRINGIILVDFNNKKQYKYIYSFFDPEYSLQQNLISTEKDFVMSQFMENDFECFYINNNKKDSILYMTKREILNSSIKLILSQLEMIEYLI